MATITDPTRIARELALLVLLSFLWGGAFALIKIALGTLPPVAIVAARVAIAAAVLLLAARLRGLRIPTGKRLWGGFLVQGCLQSAVPFTLITWGEKHIDSGLAGVLSATPPLFVFLITYPAIRREGAALRTSLGIVCGFAGVLAIIGTEALDGIGHAILAQAAVIGASLSYALAAIYGRRFAGLLPLLSAGCAMAMAALLMVPASLAFAPPWTLAPSAEAIVAVGALALFSTAIALLIYFRLLRTLGALGTTSGSYLRAGFSVLIGVTVLGESLSWSLLAGIGLILAGVAMINQRR